MSDDENVILVLGNEGKGLRKNVSEVCERHMIIEGGGGDDGIVDSLNVSVAAGILLSKLI